MHLNLRRGARFCRCLCVEGCLAFPFLGGLARSLACELACSLVRLGFVDVLSKCSPPWLEPWGGPCIFVYQNF